jgi:general secretion pathway protein K
MNRYRIDNNRGVALLITLLVTALLIALIFEFAYGTRVSLRAAVNYRDSQRAYFLARSGVNFVGRVLADNLRKGMLQANLEQKEWQVVPIVSGGDTELRVRWEDERGKININTIDSRGWVQQLFENQGISQDFAYQLKEIIKESNNKIDLLTKLHQVLHDEEYEKVQSFLTTSSDNQIDVNTASEEVLRSVLVGKSISPGTIIANRNDKPYTTLAGTDINNTDFATTSDYFKVYANGTVGDYTKEVVAVIKRTTAGFSVLYWRSL